MNKKTIINTEEIRLLYKEYYKSNNVEFSEDDFSKFMKFLEIDFYDWIKSNLKSFDLEQEDYSEQTAAV